MEPSDKLNFSKKAKRKKVFRYFLALVLLIALLVFAYVYFILTDFIGTDPNEKGGPFNPFSVITPLDHPVNILVLGSDLSYDRRGKRDEGPTRSDTMIFVRIDPALNEVRAISIPRDSRVSIPGYAYEDKINAAYSFGGEKLARETVSSLLGVPVDHYVILKVDGLEKIIDILDGIDIYVERDMHYIDNTAKLNIDLKKGWQHLNGKQAHGYVRFRYDENGDIGRVQRQQKFIRAVSTKILNPLNFLKVLKISRQIQDNLFSDLSRKELLQIGNFARKLKKDQIRMVLMPGSFAMIGGISYWIIDQYVARNVITELFPDSGYSIPSTATNAPVINEESILRERRKFRVSIQNGTEDLNIARDVSARLKKEGWSVISISKARDLIDNSQLIVQTGINRNVPALLKSLGVQAEVINASTGDLYADYTIIIGKDFLTVNPIQSPEVEKTP
jgi:LCP family protein required for cell wall assembly